MAALEEQVASYEAMLKKLRLASDEDRNVLLNTLVFEDHLGPDPNQGASHPIFDYSGSSRMSTMTLEMTADGIASPF